MQASEKKRLKEKIRKTGIEIIGGVSWGTHLCQFYQTKEDLIDILIPYFKAGLEDNELCIWSTSEPLNEREAEEVFKKAVPDFNKYFESRQIEILPHERLLLKNGIFSPKSVLDTWTDKHNQALSRGYDGLRISVNTAWLEKRDWKNFIDYERKINKIIGKYGIIAICSYPFDKCGASEVIDVISCHQLALVKRAIKWESIETFKSTDGYLYAANQKRIEQTLQNTYQKLKETQKQLIHASKMVAMGQLAAGISHELNQPLTGIKGFAQALIMDLSDENSSLKEDLNKILFQADRMDKIIQNIRLFAKKAEFRMQEIDINQPLKDSLMLLTKQLIVHNIRLHTSFDRNLPRIQGDPNQLEQAFINLITNARDAIDNSGNMEGGDLHIKTSLSKEDKKNIVITFKDTGSGISKENLECIFNPFYTTKSSNGGMGLGLSIVHLIIKSHKGRIEVESEENTGTTFRIILPVT